MVRGPGAAWPCWFMAADGATWSGGPGMTRTCGTVCIGDRRSVADALASEKGLALRR